jgi:hypothetical protein
MVTPDLPKSQGSEFESSQGRRFGMKRVSFLSVVLVLTLGLVIYQFVSMWVTLGQFQDGCEIAKVQAVFQPGYATFRKLCDPEELEVLKIQVLDVPDYQVAKAIRVIPYTTVVRILQFEVERSYSKENFAKVELESGMVGWVRAKLLKPLAPENPN